MLEPSVVRFASALIACAVFCPVACSASTAPTTTLPSPSTDQGTDSLLVVGDSYAAGEGARSPLTSFAWETGRALRAQTTVDAVSGTGFVNPGPSDVDQRYGTRVDALPDAALQVDVVVIEGGLNDRAAPSDEVRAAAEALLRSLTRRAPGTQIVLMGATAPQPASPQDSEEVNAALADAAQTVDVTFIDPVALEWFTPENVAEYVAPDGLHPTQSGHDHLADLLADEIAALPRD